MNLINKKFKDKEIIFDYVKDGVVYLNATKTAKQFGKEAHRWLALKETQEYISLLEKRRNSNPAQNGFGDFVVVRKGGNNEKLRGTWLNPKLTIFFARWLDMEFSIWCDETIEEIMKNGFYISKEAKQNPSKKLIRFSSSIMQTRKATILKRDKLYSRIEKFLDSETGYKENSLNRVVSTVYQHLHIATSLKTAVLVIQDNLINSKDGLKINSYNPKQKKPYDKDYIVAMNYYNEKQLKLFDRYFLGILEDVIKHLDSPHTLPTSKSVIKILKDSGIRQIKLVTELDLGTTFQGKVRTEIDELVDEYKKEKMEYPEMVKKLEKLRTGKIFKI